MSAAKLKVMFRDLMPAASQVPSKYWFGRLAGKLEPEMALLDALVARGERAIDVGGNRGAYAYYLARLGARVEVFEPNPACLRVLRPWAKAAGVAIHPVALSASAGEATLHVPRDAAGIEHDASGSIEHVADGDMRDRTVPLRTLDSFGFGDAALIKIDVEGHEHSVIAGAAQTIAAARPALLVEIEQRHLARPMADVFGQVAAFGYYGFFLDGERLARIEAFDPAVHQSPAAFGTPGATYLNNFLFLAEEKLEAGRYAALRQRWMAP